MILSKKKKTDRNFENKKKDLFLNKRHVFYNNHSRSTYTVIGSNSLGKILVLNARTSGDCRLKLNMKCPYP